MTEPTDIPGPDHRAEGPEHASITFINEDGTPVVPTQQQYPWKAFWRTILQVGPAAALGLLVILPQLLQEILDFYGHQLPGEIYTALVSVTAALTLVAGIAAKVMANARAIEWFRKYAPFFAPEKK